MKIRKLDSFRIPIRRSNDGVILGVMRGFAEHYGWPVFWTRVLGTVLLLIIPSFFPGHHNGGFFAAGFFYLLLTLLMEPPLKEGEMPSGNLDDSDSGRSSMWNRRFRRRFDRFASGPSPSGGSSVLPVSGAGGGRLDLAALNRQLDSLNRRIARMESIVTRREYDWSRRLDG